MKEKIAIWGTGKVAKRFYILYCKEFDVACFFDNKAKSYKEEECEKLYGIPILRWSPENIYKIVIASSFWREIADQLNGYGLLPFKDYVLWKHTTDCEPVWYSDIYELMNMRGGVKEYRLCFENKKIAIVYGNCQTRVIGRILKSNRSFRQDYVIVTVPMVFEYETKKEMLEYLINDECFWKQVDLFVYQPVSENNKFSPILCTDRVIDNLKETCKKVEILNLYFTGYFPQMIVGGSKVLNELNQAGLIPFGDKYIDGFIENGMNQEEIMNIVLDENFIGAAEIIQNAESSLAELERREQQADVKITDYIKEHYQKKQLFYSCNHPNEELILEYTNRLLKFLNYDETEISIPDYFISCGSLKGQDIPVYPSVIKAFGMEKYEKKYYPNRYIDSRILLDIKGFIKLYIEVRSER